jgi:hypothetical protein
VKRTKPNAAYNWLMAHVAHDGADCLIWPFAKNWNGYGNIGRKGKMLKAHRVMCEQAHGPAPSPSHVAGHSCHNGRGGCVNPKHLSWITASQNIRERRQSRKRWTNRGTLSDAQVEQIVALRGKKNQREIAAMFGISYQHVSVVQNRRLKRQQRAA